MTAVDSFSPLWYDAGPPEREFIPTADLAGGLCFRRLLVKERLERIIVEMVEKGIRLELAAKDFEKKYLKIALDLNQGSRRATAKALGIHRNTLNNKLGKHQLRGA